ncbi:MAG: hypothetical protein ACI9IP_001331 [Arcticibacterium sp.]|jgi:hypothetical protein
MIIHLVNKANGTITFESYCPFTNIWVVISNSHSVID